MLPCMQLPNLSVMRLYCYCYLSDVEGEKIISPEERIKVSQYTDKVSAIREVLSRDHMKVVFFGR